MGEMADYNLEMVWGDEFDEEPKRNQAYCRYCGRGPFNWRAFKIIKGRCVFRLVGSRNRIHRCKAWRREQQKKGRRS